MKFRRKTRPVGNGAAGPTALTPSFGAPDRVEEVTTGPFDVDDVDLEVQRVDLGSLLIEPGQGRDVRLQVDEKTKNVQAVLIAGADGAIELRAFAAPRNGDLWGDTLPQIKAATERRGGTAVEREGRFGPELACEITVKKADGEDTQQLSRVIGVNGPRWMLRATVIGRPAVDATAGAEWEDVLAQVVVRRGTSPMAVGDALPITVPEQARRIK